MAILCTGIVITAIDSMQTTGTPLYTSVGNNAITCVIVCNNHPTNTINLSLYAVPVGVTPYAAPQSIIVSNLAIPAGETVTFDQEKMVLGDGDSLQAVADYVWDGTGLTATVSTLPV